MSLCLQLRPVFLHLPINIPQMGPHHELLSIPPQDSLSRDSLNTPYFIRLLSQAAKLGVSLVSTPYPHSPRITNSLTRLEPFVLWSRQPLNLPVLLEHPPTSAAPCFPLTHFQSTLHPAATVIRKR